MSGDGTVGRPVGTAARVGVVAERCAGSMLRVIDGTGALGVSPEVEGRGVLVLGLPQATRVAAMAAQRADTTIWCAVLGMAQR